MAFYFYCLFCAVAADTSRTPKSTRRHTHTHTHTLTHAHTTLPHTLTHSDSEVGVRGREEEVEEDLEFSLSNYIDKLGDKK